MQFAFEYKLKDEKRKTFYTKENQALLAYSMNNDVGTIKVFHETQNGPRKGEVVMHEVSFKDMTVTNTKNGWVHKLLLTIPDPEKLCNHDCVLCNHKACYRDCKYCIGMESITVLLDIITEAQSRARMASSSNK